MDERPKERDAPLEQLPKHNYYQRVIINSTDPLLLALKESCIIKLDPLMVPLLKASGISTPTIDMIKKLIIDYNDAIKALPADNPRKAVLAADVNVLNDWVKIKLLTPLTIPKDQGAPLIYCTLETSAGGVTEKIALISLQTTHKQLKAFNAAPIHNLETYHEKRADFELKTEAILKLPKRGDIKEIQREMMALNISRLLGHKTTASTMASYSNQPVLFIPFDKIKLLNEYTTGQTFQANYGLIGKQTYTHYSTVNPVGEGLHHNQFLDDFGKTLGLLYIASDTDVIGGYAQNKAIIDDRSLYIFDTVLMAQDKLGLDSRLCTQPVQLLMKYTRHGQGRNKTLIEDGDFNDKFNSIKMLLEKKSLFTQYLDSVIKSYQSQEKILNTAIANATEKTKQVTFKKTLSDIIILRSDAEKLKQTVNKRIDDISAIFPKGDNQPPNLNSIRQALLLEKIINMPRLFTDDGRPYRHPWTTRNTINITQIKPLVDKVELTFNTPLPTLNLTFLKIQQKVNSVTQTTEYSITISNQDLQSLNETTLYKEHQNTLTEKEPILSKGYANLLQKVYQPDTKLPADLSEVIAATDEKNSAKRDVLLARRHLIETLKSSLESGDHTINKGLYKHLLKKVYYDEALFFLSNIKDPDDKVQFKEAFSAAVTLDRLEAFHQASFKACEKDQLQTPEFKAYLDACIALKANALTHTNAIEMSQKLTLLTTTYVKSTQLSLISTDKTLETTTVEPPATLKEPVHTQELSIAADSDNIPVVHETTGFIIK